MLAVLVVGCGDPSGASDSGGLTLTATASTTTGGSSGGTTSDTGGATGGATTGDPATGGLTDGTTSDGGSTSGGPPPGTNPSPGCGAAPPGAAPSSVQVGGSNRTFILETPTSYDPNYPYPVIFGWHGTGHQGADARAQMKLHETAQGNAFVIYPNGGASAPVWQFPGGANVTDPQRDLDFFDAMVDLVSEQYCVDGNSIFSTGFSQGAFFSNALGCERPWMVAGIAPVGGGGPWQCNATDMAAMIIIGTADNVSGADNPYGYNNSAQMSRDFWLGGNNCGQGTTPVDPSPCVEYDCPDKPVVYCEFNGGHTWWANASLGMMLFFNGL